MRRPRRGKHDRAHQGALSPACLYYRSYSRVGAGTLQPAHHRQRTPSHAQRRRSQRLHLRNANALTIYIVGQPPAPAQAMLTSPPPSVALPNSHAPIARASRHPPAHDRSPNAPQTPALWLAPCQRSIAARTSMPQARAQSPSTRTAGRPARRIMAQMPADNRYKARAATQICRAPHLTRVSKRDKLNLIILH